MPLGHPGGLGKALPSIQLDVFHSYNFLASVRFYPTSALSCSKKEQENRDRHILCSPESRASAYPRKGVPKGSIFGKSLEGNKNKHISTSSEGGHGTAKSSAHVLPTTFQLASDVGVDQRE